MIINDAFAEKLQQIPNKTFNVHIIRILQQTATSTALIQDGLVTISAHYVLKRMEITPVFIKFKTNHDTQELDCWW